MCPCGRSGSWEGCSSGALIASDEHTGMRVQDRLAARTSGGLQSADDTDGRPILHDRTVQGLNDKWTRLEIAPGVRVYLPVTSRAADALDDLGLAQGPLSALHLPVASLDLGGYVLGRGLGVCSDLGEHDGLGARSTSRRTSDVPDTPSDIISDITDMTSDVSDVIPAVSDVAREAHVNGEPHAVGLAKLLEEGVGDARVACGVPENVKAAARLLSEPDEVEHLE